MEVPTTSKLGQNILIVIDNCPACLAMLRQIVSRLPQVAHRFFTLLDCCPPFYWEHGAGPAEEVRHEIIAEWQAEDAAFRLTRQYLEEAQCILQAAGVPASHIQLRTAIAEGRLIDAITEALRHGTYSGVIINGQHADVVRRLRGQGLTDRFRQIPKVTVWAIDTVALNETAHT
jgi:hypothetical protein